jgi:colanic acid/amylovoran biosynthesis glycosyltransferase
MARRVALVLSAFPRVSETFIVSKFAGLVRRGWDVHVVCARSDPRDWNGFPEIAGAPEIRRRVHVGWPDRPRWKAALVAPWVLARSILLAPRRTLRYLRLARRRLGLAGALRRLYLDAELVRLGPDIVHFEFGALAPARMDLAELLGCRIVVSFRGYDLNFVGLDEPDHYGGVWKRADGLHFLGEDLWRRARRRGCPAEVMHALIPPAIDAGFFQPDARPRRETREASEPLRILSVGRLEWKKGYEDALIAVRQLLDRGVPCRYRVVGDGEYLGAVSFVRHELGLEGIVELLGAQPRRDVLREMQEADVLLHAATSEGFSNAVMEAQAMELPVICSDADGLSENVADGETGFVVARRDFTAMADRLERLARDPGLRRRMGEAGRRRVLEKFRLDDQIDRFEDLYRRVLGTARPPAHPVAAAEKPAESAEPAELAGSVKGA